MTYGPNHRHVEGRLYSGHYIGYGYNRVRACSCGAEDHDPEPADEPRCPVCDTMIRAQAEADKRDAERWRAIEPLLLTQRHVDEDHVCGTYFNPPRPCDCSRKELIAFVRRLVEERRREAKP